MVQPLIITKQELMPDSNVKLQFRINKPGVFDYIPEYCAYTLDDGTTWYKCAEVRKHGHNDDPLFVPQGGQGFLYIFKGPSEDEIDSIGSLYPAMITRLTILERDCNGGTLPNPPPYMDPTDPGTGGVPPFTGNVPPVGNPPNPPPQDDDGNPNPVQPKPPGAEGEGSGTTTGGDPAPGGTPPSPGTPTDDDKPDTLPPGTPTYPGYPGSPGDLTDPPTGTPNEPDPPDSPDEPEPGDDSTPTPPDSGPGSGDTDPRPNNPGDAPTAPPGGFDPAPPVPTDPDGEGGPGIPEPAPGSAPDDGPEDDGPWYSDPPPISPPTPPGGMGSLSTPPIAPGGSPGDALPNPMGDGRVVMPPEVPEKELLVVPDTPPGYVDPGGIPSPDGNVDGLLIYPAHRSSGSALGVPVDGGSNESFPYEAGGSPLTFQPYIDMGEIGHPVGEVPVGSPSGLVLEVWGMPNEVYAETNAMVITARVENSSYGGNLLEAYIQLDLILPDGRPVYITQATRFGLPQGRYYAVSKVIPAHSLWPPGEMHVHATLFVNEVAVGDAVNTVHIFDRPPPELL